jgi:undecaprenyl-diphosphatase
MSVLEAIILGLVQGLTEFLPISSTAHLTLAGNIMGLIKPESPEQWTAFIAIIQLGTLLAVLLYFWQDILNISKAFLTENFQRKSFSNQSPDSRMGWFVIIGSIPIGVLGLALKKIIEGSFTKDLSVIGISLIVLALILFIAEKVATLQRNINQATWRDALIVGLAQVLALIPGSSRSGTTITAGLFLGLNRESAARFSFLLSIPAILGSGYQALEFMSDDMFMPLIIATIAAGISGYASIAFLLQFLRTHSTNVFILYRIALGIGVLLFVML